MHFSITNSMFGYNWDKNNPIFWFISIMIKYVLQNSIIIQFLLGFNGSYGTMPMCIIEYENENLQLGKYTFIISSMIWPKYVASIIQILYMRIHSHPIPLISIEWNICFQRSAVTFIFGENFEWESTFQTIFWKSRQI